PRELWGFGGMRIEEEYSPKRGMGTGNILNGGGCSRFGLDRF
ncbi:hypothetical protein A2U01_0093877, partial [Trifolium medium]|nr:hypothetical protein [Trifolium medium]